jgi:mono/diheme cytochrome c family protein
MIRATSVLTLLPLLAAASDDLPSRAAAILKTQCNACHGAALKMSGLDLRTRESMLAGGERGPALQPGNSQSSRLYRLAAGLDKPTMPPGKTLAQPDLATLREWIDSGANLSLAPSTPDDPQAALAKLEERPITPKERNYWAFRKPVRADIPNNGSRNPVDAFLTATIQSRGLTPAPPANRRTLIRRAYLDLTGLPPTPEAVEAFLRDTSPNAFSQLIDELLASPHYGERWGRHWLDLVRYADSGGFEYDRDWPNAWRYRDYVIQSFNAGKPYNRFIQEQLAGDEIVPGNHEALIATGYLRLGLENNIKTEQTRLDELDDLVSTTSTAFLGVTVGCARCHNHKFDPIPQKDYYRLQAVFFPTKAAEIPLVPAAEIAQFEAEQKRIDALAAPVKKQLSELEKPYRDRILDEKKSRLPDYIQIALKTPPEQRTEGQRLNATQVEKTLGVESEELLAALSEPDRARHTELKQEIARIDGQRPKPLPAAMTVKEPGRVAPESHFLHRGSPGQKGSVVTPGVLTVATAAEYTFPEPPESADTSYRRRGLAQWVADPDNPLTARVMVNRIWQHHFGEGLVRTPNNFGTTGEPPSHPELLDWLATEFIRTGWSLKAMHRLIMNSDAYQRSSEDVAVSAAADSDNRYLWRMPRRRLEAEAIRDSILAVAGNLDRTVGGPAVHPYIDPALFQSSSKRTWHGKPDSDPSTWRRSVYVFSKRSIPLPMLDVFDKPDSVNSCARRNRSTIAPQSLIMMNNSLIVMEAKMFAERLRREPATTCPPRSTALSAWPSPVPPNPPNSTAPSPSSAKTITDSKISARRCST